MEEERLIACIRYSKTLADTADVLTGLMQGITISLLLLVIVNAPMNFFPADLIPLWIPTPGL